MKRQMDIVKPKAAGPEKPQSNLASINILGVIAIAILAIILFAFFYYFNASF